ncbi:hypothetical protein BDW22DRAFT_1068113 [Trametopsis cervina]|nr:hypothetical protein BDW22DRAFT_1068113 [Trametopsis cervina]
MLFQIMQRKCFVCVLVELQYATASELTDVVIRQVHPLRRVLYLRHFRTRRACISHCLWLQYLVMPRQPLEPTLARRLLCELAASSPASMSRAYRCRDSASSAFPVCPSRTTYFKT